MATSKTGKPDTVSSGPRSQQDLETEIELLKAEIAALAKQVQTVGEHSYGTARRAAAEGVDRLRAQGEAAIENLREGASDLEGQLVAHVREKPVTALAMAAGVGFLFALISRR